MAEKRCLVVCITLCAALLMAGVFYATRGRLFENPSAEAAEYLTRRNIYMFTQEKRVLRDDGSSQRAVCTAPECHRIAELLQGSLDTSVSPCDDFYSFSCGGWIKTHPIPKSYNDYSTFTKLSKEIEDKLRGLLEDSHSRLFDADSNSSEKSPHSKARDFYRSCMDTEEINRLGPRPMQEFIRKIGGWSICGDGSWNKSDWDVHKVMHKLQSTYYPASPFFSVEVTNDHLNSTKHLIKIEQSGLSLQREIYFKHPEMVQTYVEYMAKVAKLLGTKCDTTKKMREIMDFEIKLAKFTTTAEAKAEGIYRRIKLHSLIQVVPKFPWLRHMRAVFQGAHVTDADVVLATSLSYLRKVANLMRKTPKELLSNYIVWQMIRDKVSLLSDDFRKARAEFNEKISGVKDTDPRWRICTGVTNDNMGVPLGTLYVGKYFNQSTTEKTRIMIDEIRKIFKKRVKDHEWIDDVTTKHVFDKASDWNTDMTDKGIERSYWGEPASQNQEI